jgi:hypothetical protein
MAADMVIATVGTLIFWTAWAGIVGFLFGMRLPVVTYPQ